MADSFSDVVTAFAAAVAAIASVISALKASNASDQATSVLGRTQTIERAISKIELTLTQQITQSQSVNLYNNFGPITQNLGSVAEGQLKATEKSRLPDETQIQWPQVPQAEPAPSAGPEWEDTEPPTKE